MGLINEIRDDYARLVLYDKAMRWAGTRYQLAKALSITHQAVYAWKGVIPLRYEVRLKALMRRKWTHSMVTRAQTQQDRAGGLE